MQILSRLDLYEIGRQYVLTRAKRIDPRVIDTEGSDVNLVVGAASYMGAAVSNQIAQNAADLFLDSVLGEALDRYAFDRYQLVRQGAAAALGTVQFTRPTAAVGAGSIPLGTKLVSLTGTEYLTITAASFTASGAGSLSTQADVRSAQAGATYQVGANAIRAFADPAQSFDRSIVLTNPSACAGGEDPEDDDTFKSRIRDFWRTSRRGTLGAIEFGARAVPGVASALALDEIGSFGQPVRVVRLFIADSSGTASQALAAQVQQSLAEYRAGGIFVFIDLSQPQLVDISLKLVFQAGVDTVSLSNQVQAAVVAYVNTLGVGQVLQLADLYAVLSRYKSSGLIVSVPGTVVSPVGDLVAAAQHTLRTTLSNVTLS